MEENHEDSADHDTDYALILRHTLAPMWAGTAARRGPAPSFSPQPCPRSIPHAPTGTDVTASTGSQRRNSTPDPRSGPTRTRSRISESSPTPRPGPRFNCRSRAHGRCTSQRSRRRAGLRDPAPHESRPAHRPDPHFHQSESQLLSPPQS